MTVTTTIVVRCDYCNETVELSISTDWATKLDKQKKNYLSELSDRGWAFFQNEDMSFRRTLCPRHQSKDEGY